MPEDVPLTIGTLRDRLVDAGEPDINATLRGSTEGLAIIRPSNRILLGFRYWLGMPIPWPTVKRTGFQFGERECGFQILREFETEAELCAYLWNLYGDDKSGAT